MSIIFGEFLVNKGIVSEVDLMEALDSQRESKTPIGNLAVQKDMITKKDLFKILTLQKKSNGKGKDFGYIAKELGLLSDEQLKELAEAQQTNSKLIGEVLVARQLIAKEQLLRLLREFQAGRSV